MLRFIRNQLIDYLNNNLNGYRNRYNLNTLKSRNIDISNEL